MMLTIIYYARQQKTHVEEREYRLYNFGVHRDQQREMSTTL